MGIRQQSIRGQCEIGSAHAGRTTASLSEAEAACWPGIGVSLKVVSANVEFDCGSREWVSKLSVGDLRHA